MALTGNGSGGAGGPGGGVLAAALSDGSARVSACGGGVGGVQQQVAILKLDDGAHLTAIEWSADGRTLVTCRGDGTVLLWDSRTWQCRARFSGVHNRAAFGSVFHPAVPELLLTWSSDGSAGLWDSNAIGEAPPIGAFIPDANSASCYPLLRCEFSERGDALVAVGGGSEASFMGMPAWFYRFPTRPAPGGLGSGT